MSVFQWLWQRWNSRWMPIAARLFPGTGLVLLALAAAFALHTWYVGRPFLHGEALVTENVATQSAKGEVLYTTHLRFRLSSGSIVTFTDPVLSNDSDDPDFATGTVVPILYPSADPHTARIATVGRLYFAAIVLGILGVVFFDLGLIFRLLIKRWNAASVR